MNGSPPRSVSELLKKIIGMIDTAPQDGELIKLLGNDLNTVAAAYGNDTNSLLNVLNNLKKQPFQTEVNALKEADAALLEFKKSLNANKEIDKQTRDAYNGLLQQLTGLQVRLMILKCQAADKVVPDTKLFKDLVGVLNQKVVAMNAFTNVQLQEMHQGAHGTTTGTASSTASAISVPSVSTRDRSKSPRSRSPSSPRRLAGQLGPATSSTLTAAQQAKGIVKGGGCQRTSLQQLVYSRYY